MKVPAEVRDCTKFWGRDYGNEEGNLTSDALGVHFSSFGGARGGVSGSKYPEDTTLPIVSTWNPISCK